MGKMELELPWLMQVIRTEDAVVSFLFSNNNGKNDFNMENEWFQKFFSTE